MPFRNSEIPSFLSGPVPRDHAPRRYKDAPTTVADDGYVWEWCPTHPRAQHGCWLQHRLVVECKLGRFLTKLEKIDHEDRNRANNAEDNLILYANQSDHMKAHWIGRGKNDPHLIELVRAAAADPGVRKCDLEIGITMIDAILRKLGIPWIRGGHNAGVRRGLNEQTVREALQGRTAAEAARILGCHPQTLYDRYDHLLTKRTKPGALDCHQEEILRLVYQQGVSREEVGRRFGVSSVCVTKSIRRWRAQGAKLDESVLPEPPRQKPGPAPKRSWLEMEAQPPKRAADLPKSQLARLRKSAQRPSKNRQPSKP